MASPSPSARKRARLSSPASPAAPVLPSREVELKLFVPAGSIERLWSAPSIATAASGPRRTVRLENRYFDTPTRELAARRMGLRLRRSGDDWLQTLKTAGERHGAVASRGEWEMPVGGPALELERLAETPLGEVDGLAALGARLVPLFTTDFGREVQDLRLPDGSQVELAFDRGSIVGAEGASGPTAPICEVELEWQRSARPRVDSERALLRFAARLAAEVPLIPLAASKAERGYRLVDPMARKGEKVGLPVPAATDDCGPYLARALAAFNGVWLVEVHALLALPADDLDASVEVIHRARVGLRQLRTALQLFAPIARGRKAAAVSRALQALGRDFAVVRDLDVFATEAMSRIDDEAGPDAAGRAAFAALADATVDARTAARAALRARLDDGSVGTTALAVERLAARLARKPVGVTVGAVAPRWLARQHRRVVRLARRLAELDPPTRHRLRIEVKRLRYAIDLLGPLYDAAVVGPYRDALVALQARLGRLNDRFVTQQRLDTIDPAPRIVASRHAAWLERDLGKQLPKVAADALAFELAPLPWAPARPIAFG